MMFRRSRDGCARCAEYVRSETVGYGQAARKDIRLVESVRAGVRGPAPYWLIQPPFAAPERCADCPRRSG